MNRLTKEKRIQIISALVEGNSLRATSRMCDVAFNTVLKLVPEIGRVCADYQDKALRNLTCKRIQCDEIWQFCYAKDKNVPADKAGHFGFGSVWTWVAIDADTKLVPTVHIPASWCGEQPPLGFFVCPTRNGDRSPMNPVPQCPSSREIKMPASDVGARPNRSHLFP